MLFTEVIVMHESSSSILEMSLGIDSQVDSSSVEGLNDYRGLLIEYTVDGDFVLLMEMVVGSEW